jgi:RimJ/RimL family protein N-acetyltransferase
MVERSTNEPVGVAGISEDTNQSEPGIEFAWFVLPECQGKGYATEITRGLLGYVFEVLKKDRFIAETHPDNPGANRVLEKVGFKMVGEKHNSYDYLPDFDRQVVWEFLRDNWSG